MHILVEYTSCLSSKRQSEVIHRLAQGKCLSLLAPFLLWLSPLLFSIVVQLLYPVPKKKKMRRLVWPWRTHPSVANILKAVSEVQLDSLPGLTERQEGQVVPEFRPRGNLNTEKGYICTDAVSPNMYSNPQLCNFQIDNFEKKWNTLFSAWSIDNPQEAKERGQRQRWLTPSLVWHTDRDTHVILILLL